MKNVNYIRKSIALGITLILAGMIIQPAAAWGEMTHIVIISKLNPNGPDNGYLKTFPKFAKGGGIGPDMFYYSASSKYSDWAHTQRTAQLPARMKVLATSTAEKAYVDGWWSHFASDIRGHQDYINKFDVNLRNDVEAGVDANLAKEVSDYSFSVPYGLVQNAYKNVYGTAPSSITISAALGTQQTAIYIERTAISWGLLNKQKNTYNTFWDIYRQSILDSVSAINSNPTTNYNLATGDKISTLLLYSTTVSDKAAKNGQDKDIIDTANELLESGAVEVVIEDDKDKKVFNVNEPSIKNKNKFDKALEKLAKKKKGNK